MVHCKDPILSVFSLEIQLYAIGKRELGDNPDGMRI